MIHRGLVPVAISLGALALGACSSDTSSSPVSASYVSTTASVVAVDTTAVSSTVEAASTSSSSTSSTSTIPAVEGLDMSPRGLGDALFGAEAESVISYVDAILGEPTADSGWVDPYVIGAACPGTEVRFVEWHDLSLVFSDESFAGSGIRHFASYRYGPTMSTSIEPYGLRTDDGFGMGTTVAEMRARYPQGELYAGDEVVEPHFVVDDALVVFLTDAKPTGHAISFLGGYGCGE